MLGNTLGLGFLVGGGFGISLGFGLGGLLSFLTLYLGIFGGIPRVEDLKVMMRVCTFKAHFHR